MPALRSEAIPMAEYDADTQTLRLTFASGQSYSFHDVPQETYDGLLEAPSAGAYYHSQIKGVYS